MGFQLQTVSEATPGEKWQRCFYRVWPSYKDWYLKNGEAARTPLRGSRAVLSQHMPELVQTYDRLCRLAGNDDLASRFLSMVNPPAYLAGCSQLAWTGPEPALIRNYDFSPSLFEGVLMRTKWVRPVIGVSEGIWGLLDGINANGLAVCLSFGGRKVVGKGFGIPLVVRYLLETCATVPEACDRVRTLPVHMAYSITLLDAARQTATIHLSPDRDAVVTSEATCSNHQLNPEWPEHAVATRSVERKACLDTLLNDPNQDREALIRRFLRSPLHNDQYDGTSGTLYTAAYDPVARAVEIIWPSKRVRLSFDDFQDQIIHVNLSTSRKQATTA